MKCWKRLAVLCLSAALAVGLCACGAASSSSEETRTLTICQRSGYTLMTDGDARDLRARFPGLSVERIYVPSHRDDPAAGENVEGEMTRLRTQVMSGSGPDVFLMHSGDTLLFTDLQKQMRAGVFMDLSPYMEELRQTYPLNETVLAAGRLGQAQYLLPLTYSVPVAVAPADRLAASGAAQAESAAEWIRCLEEAFAQASMSGLFYENMGCLLAEPLLDYETGTIRWTPQARQTVEAMAAWEAAADAAEQGGAADGEVTAGLVSRNDRPLSFAGELLAQGVEPGVAAAPNGQGGVTGAVQVYFAIRANSPGWRKLWPCWSCCWTRSRWPGRATTPTPQTAGWWPVCR